MNLIGNLVNIGLIVGANFLIDSVISCCSPYNYTDFLGTSLTLKAITALTLAIIITYAPSPLSSLFFKSSIYYWIRANPYVLLASFAVSLFYGSCLRKIFTARSLTY